MWLGGHVHSYHRSWPSAGGEPTQRDYINPTAPVHILDGVGGCSGLSAYFGVKPPWMAFSAPGKPNSAAYGQLKVHNSSHATWSSIHAVTLEVIDGFTIEQRSHGPFPAPDSSGDDEVAATTTGRPHSEGLGL